MRYHLIPIRMAKTKCSNMPDAGEDEDKLDHPHTEDGKKGAVILDQSMAISYKLNLLIM